MNMDKSDKRFLALKYSREWSNNRKIKYNNYYKLLERQDMLIEDPEVNVEEFIRECKKMGLKYDDKM